jgi:hypothetical protein
MTAPPPSVHPFLGLLLAALLLLPPLPVSAAEVLRAAPLKVGESVRVDAVLDEAVWERAQVISAFVGSAPSEGFEPRGTTRVRVASDATHIYLCWEARWDEPTPVRSNISERENINYDDQIGVYFDPFGDGRRAYGFWINALGIQQDMIISAGGGFNMAWDTLFESAGRIVEGGFDIEMAIPFRSLRFPSKGGNTWKIQFKRKFAAQREYVTWPAVHKDLGPELLQFGPLEGLSPGKSGVGLELNPTIVGRAGQQRGGEGEPLLWREPSFPETVDPGFGLKWQATPSLVFDAALNPDFSQIEADPDQIDSNLRFGLFLPERRPFFLEGSELFDRHMLYTRSIVDPIYGVKLSGKEGRLSVALLHSLDEAPAPSFVGEVPTPGFGAADMEGALSFVSFASAAWDFGARNQVSLTWSDKEIVKDGQLHSSYHGLKLSTGVALDPLTMMLVGIEISETGLEGGERLVGPMAFAFLERSARLYKLGAGVLAFSPGFRSENAYFTQPDRLESVAWASRRFEFDGPIRSLEVGTDMGLSAVGLGLSDRLDLDGIRTDFWAETQLPGLTELRLEAKVWEQAYAGQTFEGKFARALLTSRGHPVIHGGVGGGGGDAIRYSTTSLTLQRSAFAFLEIRAVRRLRVELRTDVDFLGREGEELARLFIYRFKTSVAFTRAISMRVIAQGRTGEGLDPERALVFSGSRLDLSALLTLTPSPGTAIHIGYGQRLVWGLSGEVTTQSRDIFIKASGLFRI